MIPGSWVGVSILMALFAALIHLISQYFKVQAIHLLFWLRTVSVMCAIPILFLVTPPAALAYYIHVIIASVMYAYVDVLVIGLAAKSGAGIVTRLKPLGVVVTFILWTVITPELMTSYVEDPVQFIGISASIMIGIYFTLRLRDCPFSWSALKIMALPILLSGIAVMFSKAAMNNAGNLHSGVYYYPLVQGVTIWLCYAIILAVPVFRKYVPDFDFESRLFSRKVLLAGVLAGVAHLVSTIMKYYGISLAENPAYVTMIGLTAPLWVMIVYRLVGHEEEADTRSGFGVVLAVALLVFFTHL